MKITFNGAAKIVTGSCYLVETATKKILVDCGMYQGTKDITRLNYEPFRFDPKEISFLLLTHAHIDHSGLIPKLTKEGFSGKIFATFPTVDLAKLMLQDAAETNAADTEQENKRRVSAGQKPRDPIYTVDDAKDSFKYFSPVNYDTDQDLADGIMARFRNAGHILGSSIIELYITESGKTTKIVFSGDLGQWNTPIVNNPTMINDADYVLVESTYGNRSHGASGMRKELLLKEVVDTYKRGGKLLIPSFAVERTQELVYYFHELVSGKNFPDEQIFLDSPLAIDVTNVFKKYQSYFTPTLQKEFKDPFTFDRLHYLKSVDDSKTMNTYNKPCIIIAGSGMCNAGRIRHHLKYNLSKPENTILFVGYQAEGTLGRVIQDGAKVVKMMGLEIDVNAHIDKIDSFSSHADSGEITKWLEGFKTKPKKIFIIHGEEDSSTELGKELSDVGFQVHVPEIGESVTLD